MCSIILIINQFGLCNVPAMFQHLMDLILAEIQWSQLCLVNIYDVFVVGCTFEEHLQNLQAVFQSLYTVGWIKDQTLNFSFRNQLVT